MNEKLKKFTYDMSTALLGKDLVDHIVEITEMV